MPFLFAMAMQVLVALATRVREAPTMPAPAVGPMLAQAGLLTQAPEVMHTLARGAPVMLVQEAHVTPVRVAVLTRAPGVLVGARGFASNHSRYLIDILCSSHNNGVPDARSNSVT